MHTPIRFQSQLLMALVAAVCVAYFALWACAPAATVRPDLPMAQGQTVGIGLSGTRGLIGRENCRDVLLSSASSCAAGQLWLHFEALDWFQFGVVGFAGDVNGAGLGPYGRLRLVTEPNFRMAVDLSAGVAWFAAGLPIAMRLGESLWLYSEPSIGLRIFNAGRLPIGVAMDLGVFRVHAEVGAGTGSHDLTTNLDEFMGYGSVGVEVTF